MRVVDPVRTKATWVRRVHTRKERQSIAHKIATALALQFGIVCPLSSANSPRGVLRRARPNMSKNMFILHGPLPKS